MGYILNTYVAVSLVLSITSVYRLYSRYDNYFAFALAYWSWPLTNVIFYNTYLSLVIILQRVTVSCFFGEMKQNELIVSVRAIQKIREKLKMKALQFLVIIILCYSEFKMTDFLVLVLLLLSFVMHNQMILRSEYVSCILSQLINTHNPLLTDHVKVFIFFLIMLFIDYQFIKVSYSWILSNSQLPVIFLFYTLQMFLRSLEPFIKLVAHLYERFTMYEFKNLDYRLSIISFAINLPRLTILIALVLRFIISFSSVFFFFILVELIVEFIQLIKGFSKMKELTKTMENLPKVEAEEMKAQQDNICMVCFREMEDGRKLPCRHIFHQQCLKQWIQKNTNHFCPKCKRPFDFDKAADKKPHVQPQGRQRIAPQFVIQKQPLIDQVFLPSFKFQRKFMTEEELQKMQAQKPSEESIPTSEPHVQSEPQEGIYQEAGKTTNIKIGSLPYCLPTEAVYNRTSEHFVLRNRLKEFNAYLTSTLAYSQKLQMLIIPE